MEESNEITIFDDEISCSTESQTEEKEENLLNINLNSESHNEGASFSKKYVDLTVGNSKDEHCDSGKVKIEERGISVTGVVSTESCSRNKASAPMSPVGRSSNYHGVTRHRWSGKYEAHLWDNTRRIEGHRRKGRQGSYDTEEKAARAYDVAALKFWGAATKLNFPVTEYGKQLEDVKNMSRDACVTYIRRRQKDGRWQARIGLVCGSRDIYLGTFKSEEEAAEAYDVAAVKLRGRSAITNFDISNYVDMSSDHIE
ncbi:AP2-like ethylene-responsive transcription factor CRL5 isoform X2 [Carex rostrata]